jgi:glutamate-1-semialdehyde aminotransferase
VRDAEGNEWIDYVMAGGAALLGYAHPEIQAAIARQLTSSAVATLAHMLEVRVTELLCEVIPSAEMVLFGKHGSDACTAAIRTARLHTGRRKVLYSGYHGWHDWFAEILQPRLTPPGEPAALFPFELNHGAAFDACVEAHRGEIAAVILEPAAQAVTLDDPPGEADPAFLRHVADVCRAQGAVLIFDEIVTGFRYPHGTVQRATGVSPDLTCLGKALSGGMPLSALVGRREVMRAAQQAAYMPTFRGEVYSLAAAAAALEIHRRQDVPGQISAIGEALRDAVNQLSDDLGIRGGLIGVPCRMIYRFDEPDPKRRVPMRTLLQQELLQRGVLTYKGFMSPSLAHGARDLDETVSAFRGALARVREVAAEGAFVRHLEIPLF